MRDDLVTDTLVTGLTRDDAKLLIRAYYQTGTIYESGARFYGRTLADGEQDMGAHVEDVIRFIQEYPFPSQWGAL